MKKSAGILLYRHQDKMLQVFLVHPGGPFWEKKETGAWSVPKGEFLDDEDAFAAAKREFREETGAEINGNFKSLSPVKLKSGKLIYCWAVEGDIDPETITSNTFKAEWPYKSGNWKEYPEVDKAAWLDIDKAKKMINPVQVLILEELIMMLKE